MKASKRNEVKIVKTLKKESGRLSGIITVELPVEFGTEDVVERLQSTCHEVLDRYVTRNVGYYSDRRKCRVIEKSFNNFLSDYGYKELSELLDQKVDEVKESLFKIAREYDTHKDFAIELIIEV